MLIWILFALMTAALLAAVLRPCSSRCRRRAMCFSSANVYRAQLAELEVERDAGRWGESEYQAARAEIGRRLIKASETAEPVVLPPSRRTPWLALALVIAVPALALTLYLHVGSPDYADQPLASRGSRSRAGARDRPADARTRGQA